MECYVHTLLSPALMVSNRPVVFVLVGSILTIISLAFFHPTTRNTLCQCGSLQSSSPLGRLDTQQPHDPKLHLLLPVNARIAERSPNFCKTLFSAIVHGYEPTILNWDTTGDSGFMQRQKVFGTQWL